MAEQTGMSWFCRKGTKMSEELKAQEQGSNSPLQKLKRIVIKTAWLLTVVTLAFLVKENTELRAELKSQNRLVLGHETMLKNMNDTIIPEIRNDIRLTPGNCLREAKKLINIMEEGGELNVNGFQYIFLPALGCAVHTKADPAEVKHLIERSVTFADMKKLALPESLQDRLSRKGKDGLKISMNALVEGEATLFGLAK